MAGYQSAAGSTHLVAEAAPAQAAFDLVSRLFFPRDARSSGRLQTFCYFSCLIRLSDFYFHDLSVKAVVATALSFFAKTEPGVRSPEPAGLTGGTWAALWCAGRLVRGRGSLDGGALAAGSSRRICLHACGSGWGAGLRHASGLSI